MNLTDILVFGKAVNGGGSSTGGAYNVIECTSEKLKEAERIPAEIMGVELVYISGQSFKAADLIGGYIASTQDLSIMKFTEENTADDVDNGVTMSTHVDVPILLSIYDDVGMEDFTIKSGTYISGEAVPRVIDSCLLIYPA